MPTAPPMITLQEAAQQLGLHYMTVYRYVRTGKLAATQDGTVWRVRVEDVDALERSRQGVSASRPRPREAAITRQAFEARLVAGDSAGAWWMVESRLGTGLDPAGVVTTLLSPALRSIGDRWASGELTVADEHRATAAAQRVIGRLGLQFGHPGRSRGTVVVAAPAGDLHTLPVAMVADLLRWRRFDVIELGANTPADALSHAVSGSERLVAVGIAATISGHDAQVAESVEAVRLVTSAPIMVGGSAIRSEAHALRLGADRWSGTDAASALEVIETFMDKRHLRAVTHAT